MPRPLDYRPPREDPPPVTPAERVLATLVATGFIGFFLLIVIVVLASWRAR